MGKNKSKQNKNAGNSDYLWAMNYAPGIDEDVHRMQLLPLIFFTAFVILLVRMTVYTRPMEQFYWSDSGNDQVDFFSYCKMIAILICAVVVVLILAYRLFTRTLAIQRSAIYIPMLVYIVFVVLSYVFSKDKEFALLGWNDRFEGTLVLLAYMIMLFYAMNSIKTEKAVKRIICFLAGTSILLGLLGVSQALDHDFFRTKIGKMLIVPYEGWDQLDKLSFTFKNKEIYQTVYNINYVSFYLTLLIPLFGLMFIRSFLKGKEEPVWKKIIWGALFALLLFNLIGAASSGGFLGMGVVVLAALILLNKRIMIWWKPVMILLAITIVVGGVTYDRWVSELSHTVGDLSPKTSTRHHIDYFNVLSSEHIIKLSIEGNEVIFDLNPETWPEVRIYDAENKGVKLVDEKGTGGYRLDDSRFEICLLSRGEDDYGNQFFIITIDDRDWVFLQEAGKVVFINELGKIAELKTVDAMGWNNNLEFGSGRGYIWSRTLPMIKETILLGHGADTYCIYFPHNDYVGKYNVGWDNLNLIVDKPHNLYMGMAVGTGLISVFAFLSILILYVVQSIRLFWRKKYTSFVDYAGIGICLGIIGFAATGFVDDSSVSVMPMFYGLLGTGIAINMILRRAS